MIKHIKNSFLWKFLIFIYTKIRNYIIPWKTSLDKIEIEITSFCSLACHNCDRSIRQAPTNEYMSIEQITKFVQESLQLNWKWKKITLIGGEPTLHPYFFEVLSIVKKYKDKHNHCEIIVATNGYGPIVNQVLTKIPVWVTIINSKKQWNIQNFSSFNVAPCDLPEYNNKDFSKGCWITNKCGLWLTKYWYYCCWAWASEDRIFWFNIWLNGLSLVNRKTVKNQLNILCRYCGHFKENYKKDLITDDKISISWKNAYLKYKSEKPKLPTY